MNSTQLKQRNKDRNNSRRKDGKQGDGERPKYAQHQGRRRK